ncbi:MAG: S-methyl-5'-thioadenosine phosphorylase [Nitrospirae bacterium]|nr:S-methyl-5'-thioadenosine phosphorylase [Nitrospirota bacterium]
MIGLIGGSGLYEIKGLRSIEEVEVKTPYGSPSDRIKIAEIDDIKIAFLPRHSHKHNIPPHRVNYRANLWAFKELGVERIIAVNAVGGINSTYRPGDIVIPDQILDFSRSRASTFYDNEDVVHVDFTYPFCPEMRNTISDETLLQQYKLKINGTYVCTEGPRLETAAEIRFFATAGGDMVGMTGMPEAILARELELCYLMIAVITNYAAGISKEKLTTTEVLETMKGTTEKVKDLIVQAIQAFPKSRNCPCKDALNEARL